MGKKFENVSKSAGIALGAIALAIGLGGVAYADTIGVLSGTTGANEAIVVGDDTYKTENGTVYEYDDGRWEVEADKKVEDGKVYELEGGQWVLEESEDVAQPTQQADPATGTITVGDDVYKVENGTVYEYDDGRWEVEDDGIDNDLDDDADYVDDADDWDDDRDDDDDDDDDDWDDDDD